MIASAAIQYCIQILLPEQVDRRFRHWATATPGATWPEEGGHVTLLPRMTLSANAGRVRTAIAAVCSATLPFELRLTRLVLEPHIARPPLWTVLLAKRPDESRPGPSHDLRRALLSAISPLVSFAGDSYVNSPYRSHITLTLGVDETAGGRLVSAAGDAGLMAVFRAEAVWLRAYRGSSLDASRSHAFLLRGR
jgi:hypothetical protein